MAHSPVVADISISLKRAGVAIQEIVPLVRKYAAQHTQHCPAKKHNAENTSEPEQPVMTSLCCWLCLYLLYRRLSSRRQPMMDNNALVALLNNLLIICCS